MMKSVTAGFLNNRRVFLNIGHLTERIYFRSKIFLQCFLTSHFLKTEKFNTGAYLGTSFRSRGNNEKISYFSITHQINEFGSLGLYINFTPHNIIPIVYAVLAISLCGASIFWILCFSKSSIHISNIKHSIVIALIH